jgi:hypothetical protein
MIRRIGKHIRQLPTPEGRLATSVMQVTMEDLGKPVAPEIMYS